MTNPTQAQVPAGTPSTSVQGAGEAIYVRYSDDGEHIRKWGREPFDGAATYVSTPPAPASVADEARAREVLAQAFGCKATAAPERIRNGSKYVSIPVSTAIRAMLAFAAPPAGEGEREDEARADAWADFRDQHLEDGNDGYIAAAMYERVRIGFNEGWAGGRAPAFSHARAALAEGTPS